MKSGKVVWKDVFAEWDERQLRVGNGKFQRVFDLGDGLLRTTSLCDGEGRLFAEASAACNDFECYGSSLELKDLRHSLEDVQAEVRENDFLEAPHLHLTVVLYETESKTRYQREFFLYPELPAYGLRNGIATAVLANLYYTPRHRLEDDYAPYVRRRRDPLMDVLHPAKGFRITRSVEFVGHTDVQDQHVREHAAETGQTEFQGNLLYCEAQDGAGVILLQEAPPTSERREFVSCDFCLDKAGDIRSLCWGLSPSDISANRMLLSYRNAVLLYHDAQERDFVLKDYLRTRFDHSAQHRRIVCNAWGCGAFPKRLNPLFLRDEIQAAPQCGGEVYQIDDEWQAGGSLGNYVVRNQRPDIAWYWSINQEKVGCDSFAPLWELARKKGIELALWIAPSTNVAYRDHRQFADIVLDFYRKYGFRLFKVDNASFPTRECEENFETLLRDVRRESNCDVVFNLDITADQRGGFFRFLEYGLLFVENRYVCHSFGVGYHPERTLRNLWDLCHFVRPQTLQVEVPSPWDVNEKFYQAKGETDPRSYPWEYWGAIALFANPLLWFSPSSIPEDDRRRMKEVISLHRKYNDAIFGGEIFPIGARPDGSALTGFVSRNSDGTPRIALLLRERNAKTEALAMPGTAGWRCVAGEGAVRDGNLVLPKTASFALFMP
ncbi:MAG: hypothetical protein MJ202_00325 [Lentisphaeria bacterium]|nr:hypothetical protein [Lentisphaeria bacterium]